MLAFLAAAFVCLHLANGHPVWLKPSQVVAVYDEPTNGKTKTLVVTGSGNFYVRETVDDVAKVLKGAGD